MKDIRIIQTIVFLLGMVPFYVEGQGFIENITKLFEFNVGRNQQNEDPEYFVSKVVLAPIVNYEPSTSLGIGIGGKLLFKPQGAGLNTRTSNIPLSITYTLRNQFIFFSGYTIFFKDESYLLKGFLEFSKFPFSYHGIGNNTTKANRQEISFNNFLLEPLLLKKVAPSLFIGGGVRYNLNYRTILEEAFEELPAGTSLQSEIGSTSAGLELAITLDSRDNVLNALNGNFLEFSHGFYGKVLGGTHAFMLSKLNFRQYLRIDPNRLDVLGIEWFARYAWSGAPPLELSELGGQGFLRGFQEGRYRDKLALFVQAEYRWQALDRIGMVFFAGTGDVGNNLNALRINKLKYSLGTGIRLKIVKSENLNIRLDYGFGFGNENEQNFYLGISEAF